LNERHELTPVEKHGGALPKLGDIAWAAKGRQISASLTAAANTIASSNDPLKGKRFFLLAQPVEAIPKWRKEKGKLKETYEEEPDFGGPKGECLTVSGWICSRLRATDRPSSMPRRSESTNSPDAQMC
jgi:hypothetical protein